MPRSVAVLSDVHGVLPALEAVLAEPDVRAAGHMVLTGDITAGPQPVAVLARLRAEGERVVWVRGNGERPPPADDTIGDWAAAQLGPADAAMLAGLPHPVELTVDGFGTVLFCHGTPRRDDEIVPVDTPLSKWAEVLRGAPQTVVCGHTHMPFARLAAGRQVVNTGSVGMPYGRAGAHWALLTDGAVGLRRTEYDLDTACSPVVAGSTYPHMREWVDEYVPARKSDSAALRTFAAPDGRD